MEKKVVASKKGMFNFPFVSNLKEKK